MQSVQTTYVVSDVETETVECSGFIQYVESLGENDTSEMMLTRVIPSFLGAMRRHRVDIFGREALIYWMLEMRLQAFKASTVRRYLGGMHTLYSRWLSASGHVGDDCGSVMPVDFSFSDSIWPDDESAVRIKHTLSSLRHMGRMMETLAGPGSDAYTFNHALRYIIVNPEATLTDVVNLKFTDSTPHSRHIDDIKKSMRNMPQAKYVFPLQQGKRRHKAILRTLQEGLSVAAGQAGIDVGSPFSRESVTSLWIAAAVAVGIPVAEIRSVVKVMPCQYSFLSGVAAEAVSEERKAGIIDRVADVLINNATAWYAMRLRSGVEPDDIYRILIEKDFRDFKRMDFFYPVHKIRRTIREKTVMTDVPVLPGILFFRIAYDRIRCMMSMIGEKAWCFRSSATGQGKYSAIPQREMVLFQRSIGALTADVEMEILSSLPPLEVGDMVVIEDGTPLDGQRAVVRKVMKTDGSLHCTLRLSDTEFIHWKDVTLPASALTPCN